MMLHSIMLNRMRNKARRVTEQALRRARHHLPYPRLWAAAVGARIPADSITGRSSGLLRPEGCAFAPSGDALGISNSGGHSLSFHARTGTFGNRYETAPFGVISEPDRLRFVHDLAFSPDGRHVATVGRDAHALSLFCVPYSNAGVKGSQWVRYLQGAECGLQYPASVSLHPSGRYLAVANRMLMGIALYSTADGYHRVESTPFQVITEEELSSFGMAAPHGLDFTPDGESLIVAHHRFFKNRNSKGDSGLAVFRCRKEPDTGLDPCPASVKPTGRVRLHSVACHPSAGLLAVTDVRGGIDLFDWLADEMTMRKSGSIRLFRAGQGPKGVAFTRDGKALAVTTELNEVLFYEMGAHSSRGSP